MNRIIQSNVLDCISATQLYNALKQLKTLSKIQAEQQKKGSMIDISFSQQKYYQPQQKSFKTKGNQEMSMSFKLYQSKRLEQKGQKTTRKKIPKPQLPLVRQVKANPKSHSIIREKQQKGEAWLPIHLRTKKDLQKKKQNIQKLRNILESSKVDDNIRECTFKPRLNPASQQYAAKLKQINGGKIDNVHSLCSGHYKKENKENILITSQQIQCAFIDKKQDRHKSVTPKKSVRPKSRINTQISSDMIYIPTKDEEQKPKPKNKSFNMLLDLIK